MFSKFEIISDYYLKLTIYIYIYSSHVIKLFIQLKYVILKFYNEKFNKFQIFIYKFLIYIDIWTYKYIIYSIILLKLVVICLNIYKNYPFNYNKLYNYKITLNKFKKIT